MQWFRIALAGLIAAQSMIFSLAINLSPPEGLARTILHSILAACAVAVFFLVGLPLTRSALKAAGQGRIVVDQLFLLGIVGAFALSLHSSVSGYGTVYYEVVAILLAIHTFGRVLAENRRMQASESRDRLRADLNLATVLQPDGTRVTRHASTLQTGERVEVKPGAAIPIDGRIVEGAGYLQETALTGEPFPVVRETGDLVQAGVWSVDARFVIEALQPGSERRIDHFLDGVASALKFPSTLQQQADRIAAWFLPAVLTVSGGTLLFWWWQAGWTVAIFNALAVILVACPCALGLATPLGLWTALHRLSALGLVARSGEVIEKLAAAREVILDKTGTLTEGEMRLARLEPLPGIDLPELLSQTAALQRAFDHPVARAFHSVEPDETNECREARMLPGIGVEGVVAGLSGTHRLAIGNPKLFEYFNLKGPAANTCQNATRLEIFRDGAPAASVWLEEVARPSAKEMVAAFESAGLQVSLLSGDQSSRVEAVSRELGIPVATGESTPESKLALVQQMKAEGRSPLFVGDGLNDAGAIAAADCGIALLDGADVTVESADAVLTHDNLAILPEAILTCRKLVDVIRQNILFAGAYNVVGMTLAACGLVHPIVAALLMLVASATVVGRALRFDAKVREEGWSPQEKPERIALTLPQIQGRDAGVMALAMGQAVALAWLGGFSAELTGWFVAGGLAAGFLSLALLHHSAPGSRAGMAVWMVLLGGPAMLAGWWIDAGWGAIVRDGVCLCGCVQSDLGWGIALNPGWMHLGMLLSGFLVMGWCMRRRQSGGRMAFLLALFIAVTAMMFGMELGALAVAPVPVGDGHLTFLLAYSAMMSGMTIAMLIACELTRRWESRRAILPEPISPSAG